ncbi:hypothetical protein LINPERHAP1_LOCUS2591 [Linum perenne]
MVKGRFIEYCRPVRPFENDTVLKTYSKYCIQIYRFEMELHMVHKTSNGTIAVVAFMYMFGESDPFLTKVKSVSPLQVQALKNAVHKGFQRNARPSQLLNGRTVHVYN